MRRILRVEHLVPLISVAIFVLIVTVDPDPPCTLRTPCGPDVASWVELGLLVAPAIMVYAHRWAAAWGAVTCAVAWPLLDRFAIDRLGWAMFLPLVLALVAAFVARHRTARFEHLSPRAMVSPPPALPRVGGSLIVAAAVVFVASAGFGGWVAWRQDRVEQQEARARVAGGTVREQIDDDGVPVIRVELADGSSQRLKVLSTDDYPPGSPVEVLVDDAGLRQLRSQPYDLTPLLTWSLGGLGLAVALLVRALQRRRDLRALFARPQPVRTVRVVDFYGIVHILVPAADGRTAAEFAIQVDETFPPPDVGHEDDEELETTAALLYGEPRSGRWVAVEVGGRVRVPVEPVDDVVEVPYDAEHHLPQELYEDEAQLVDPVQLTAADRNAAPADVREHRTAPARRWFEAVAIGVGVTAAVAEGIHLIDKWRGWPVWLTLALVAAVAYEFGWRTQLRPRLRWDVGGIAAVTFRGRERAMWTADSGIVTDDDGTVIVTTGDVVLVVDAPKPWPPWTPQRTAEQLVAALRDARRQALDMVDAPAPPDIDEPGRPFALYLVWAATIALAMVLFRW
jgi:hypothetical protein